MGKEEVGGHRATRIQGRLSVGNGAMKVVRGKGVAHRGVGKNTATESREIG